MKVFVLVIFVCVYSYYINIFNMQEEYVSMGIFLVIMLLFMVLKGIEEFKCLVDIDD